MVGQLYLSVYLFYQAENFPDYKTWNPAFASTYYFDHMTCPVITLLKFGK